MSGHVYIANADFRMVPLDGLTVLYDTPSGMTHILATPAPEILEALAAGPADSGELLRRLRRRFAFEGGETIHARLGELESAGLVRRA